MARYAYHGTFKDGNGLVVPSGTVSVNTAGGGAASIYTASSGGVAVGSVTSNATDGDYVFFVDTNDYDRDQLFDIVLSKTGYVSNTYSSVVVFPSLAPAWKDVTDYGVVMDDATADAANSVALQTLLDAGGDIRVPPGKLYFDTTLYIRKGFNTCFGGYRSIGGRWGSSQTSLTELVFTGAVGTSAIWIGGAPGYGNLVGGANRVEGVRLHDFYLHPEVAFVMAHGLVVDAADTVEATRGFARDMTFENVHIKYTDGNGILFTGSVFDVSLYDCSISNTHDTAVWCKTTSSLEGPGFPANIQLFNCLVYGMDHAEADVNADCWAIDGVGWIMHGGYVHGDFGARMAWLSAMYGTHVEGLNSHADVSVGAGINIIAKGVQFYPAYLSNWAIGIEVGSASTGDIQGYFGVVPLIETCTSGITVTANATAQRLGLIEVGSYAADVTTAVTDGVQSGALRTKSLGFYTGGTSVADNCYLLRDTERLGFGHNRPRHLFEYDKDASSGTFYYKSHDNASAEQTRKSTVSKQATEICIRQGNFVEVDNWVELAASATPSVAGNTLFYTQGTTRITDLTGAVEGQHIIIEATANISIADNGNFFLLGGDGAGAADYAMTNTDSLHLVCRDGGASFLELTRSVN